MNLCDEIEVHESKVATSLERFVALSICALVMIFEDGGTTGHAKIIDFGLSKQHKSGKKAPVHGLGTVPYMSPEIHRTRTRIVSDFVLDIFGAEEADLHKSDVFAMG